jgi:hypothetical protein
MPLRRFAVLALAFAFLHGTLTIASEVIAFGAGTNLNHPEIQPSYAQRQFSLLLEILMQPGGKLWGALGVTRKSSLLEWTAMSLNSVA